MYFTETCTAWLIGATVVLMSGDNLQPILWRQIYNPFGNITISILLGAIPVVMMLVGLGFLHLKAHIAAGAGLLAALATAVFAYGMPASMAGNAAFMAG